MLPRPGAQLGGPGRVGRRIVVGARIEAKRIIGIAEIERVLRENIEDTDALPSIVSGLQA